MRQGGTNSARLRSDTPRPTVRQKHRTACGFICATEISVHCIVPWRLEQPRALARREVLVGFRHASGGNDNSDTALTDMGCRSNWSFRTGKSVASRTNAAPEAKLLWSGRIRG